MKTINLFGAPGASKSTTAAHLFALMKHSGCNVELCSEYAKKVVWEGHTNLLNDQLYITAKQNRTLERLRDKVDYAISDSPLLLGLIYANVNYYRHYSSLVREIFNSYDNINFLIKRVKKYNPVGRTQTEDESDQIGAKIKNLLDNESMPYFEVDGSKDAAQKILHLIGLDAN